MVKSVPITHLKSAALYFYIGYMKKVKKRNLDGMKRWAVLTVCFLASWQSDLRHSSTSQSVLCRSLSQLNTKLSHLTVSPPPPAVTAITDPDRHPAPACRSRTMAWITPITRKAAANHPRISMSRTSTRRQLKSSYHTASSPQRSDKRYHASCKVRSAMGPRRRRPVAAAGFARSAPEWTPRRQDG